MAKFQLIYCSLEMTQSPPKTVALSTRNCVLVMRFKLASIVGVLSPVSISRQNILAPMPFLRLPLSI